MGFFAACNFFIADTVSRATLNTALFFAPFGSSEEIASCNYPLIWRHSTFVYGITTS